MNMDISELMETILMVADEICWSKYGIPYYELPDSVRCLAILDAHDYIKERMMEISHGRCL